MPELSEAYQDIIPLPSQPSPITEEHQDIIPLKPATSTRAVASSPKLSPTQLDVGAQVVDFFTSRANGGRGYPEHVAHGIASDLFRESSLNPWVKPGDAGTSHYLAQWHDDDRKAVVHKMAQDKGESVPSIQTQLEAMDWELEHTHGKAKDALLASTSEMEAADAWMEHYEKPRDQRKGIKGRLIGRILSDPASARREFIQDAVNEVFEMPDMHISQLGEEESYMGEKGFFEGMPSYTPSIQQAGMRFRTGIEYPETPWLDVTKLPEAIPQAAKNEAALAGYYFMEGTAHFSSVLNSAINFLHRQMARDITKYPWEEQQEPVPPDILGKSIQALHENAEYFKRMIEDPNVVEEVIGGAIGGAIPGIVDFTLGPAWAAVDGYQQNGVQGMVEAVARRYALGSLLQATHGLALGPRAGLTGAAFGAEAMSRGEPWGEVGKSVATGAMMGAAGRGDRTFREAAEDFMESIPQKAIEHEQLRPAVIVDGVLHEGTFQDRHNDILKRLDFPIEGGNEERVFVTSDGKQLTREQALEYVKKNQPEVYENWLKVVSERPTVEPTIEEYIAKEVPSEAVPEEPRIEPTSAVAEEPEAKVKEFHATPLKEFRFYVYRGENKGKEPTKIASDIARTIYKPGSKGFDEASQTIGDLIDFAKNGEHSDATPQKIRKVVKSLGIEIGRQGYMADLSTATANVGGDYFKDGVWHEVGHVLLADKSGGEFWKESEGIRGEWKDFRDSHLWHENYASDAVTKRRTGGKYKTHFEYLTAQDERYAQLFNAFMTENARLKKVAPGLYDKITRLIKDHTPFIALLKNEGMNKDNWHKSIVKQAISEGKPVPPEVLADYPDLKVPTTPAKEPEFHSEDYNEAVTRTAEDFIDKLIASIPEQLKKESGAVNAKDVGNWLTEVRQKLHDAVTIDAVPRLTRASAPMAMAGIEHASSRIAAPRIARALIAKVLPEMYKFPEQLERFADLLVKDNILDIHDAFTSRALEANFKANDVIKSSWDGFKNEIAQAYEKAERAAARAKTDAGRDQARKFLDRAEAMEKQLAEAMKKFKPIGKLAGEEKEHLREAKKWLELSKNVTKLHDIDQYHIDVQEALQDPMMANAASRWTKIMNPFLDKLYLENKDLDPNTPAEGRGFYTKARVNLLTLDQEAKWEASKADLKNKMPVQAHFGNYRNPDMKAVSFDKMAKGTGEYSRNLENILLNVIGRRWQDVTKRRFYEQIVQSGNGVWADESVEIPTEIQGERAVAMPVKIVKTSKDGKSTPRTTTLYVRDSLKEEVRRILDTDMRGPDNRILRFLTAIQLAQLADATTHGKNVLSVVSAALAQASKVSMLKGFGVYDAVKRIAQVIEEVQSDTPEIRAEIADMAAKGMIREEYPHGGSIRQKIPIVRDIPHWLIVQDTAARIIMRRLYKDFVRNGLFPDDPIKEFNYVMQVGQYNRRLMGFYMQKMKDAGLSPFIVAGRNFNRQGRRLVTGYPGSETTGWQAELQMRATNLMRIGLLGLAPMIANTFITGSPMGRPGTPVFAVDLGKEEDDKGKHKVFDLAQPIGLRRGMRATGIEALVEGGRAGHSLEQIATKAGKDIYQTMFHPWSGPGVGFLAKATGLQFDIRGEMQAQKIPGGMIGQAVENLRAGLEAQNPFFYSVMRPALVSAGIDQKPDKPYVQDFLEQTFLQPLFRPIGIKDQYPSMSAAELLARTFIQQSFPEGMTPEQQRMNEQKIRLRGALRRGEDIEDLVSEGMETGGLSTKQIANIVRGSGRENIINLIDVIHDPKSVMRVFQVATDDEKDLMRDLIEGKLARSTKLTQDEKEAYKEILDRE